MKNHTPSTDEAFARIRRGVDEADYENPPELTEEEKAERAKHTIAKKGIIDRANAYIKIPLEERKASRYLLGEIQEIVDLLGEPFVLVVNQADGVPYSITFEPGGALNIPEEVGA